MFRNPGSPNGMSPKLLSSGIMPNRSSTIPRISDIADFAPSHIVRIHGEPYYLSVSGKFIRAREIQHGMCFTPGISFATAVIEFLLVAIMMYAFRPSAFRNYFAILISFLGLYQFSEFMLCTGMYPLAWAVVGFVVYSFIPAIGLDLMMEHMGIKRIKALIYVFPIAVSIFAILSPGFAGGAYCQDYFVQVLNMINAPMNGFEEIVGALYRMFYTGFIIAMAIIGILGTIYSKKAKESAVSFLVFLAVIIMSVPTYLVVFIWPEYNLSFPSVLCHFALLFALTAFCAVWIDDRR